MNFEINPSNEFTVDLNKIINDRDMPSFILKAAHDLKMNQYLPAGEYFMSLDDVEVYEMSNAVESVMTDNFKSFDVPTEQQEKDLSNLSVLCFLLAMGEGAMVLTPDDLGDMLRSLTVLITVEALNRKGQVEVVYENYSILDGSKPIARKK